jgi:serine/threonine protein kinase
MRGGSLEAALEERPGWLRGTALAKIVVGIDLGMQFVHSRGYMHRDRKPSNILLDDEHQALIGDFGSSRLEDLAIMFTKNVSMPLYMAPEMSEDNYTNKVDVFSFAMILYGIVVGQKVFRDSVSQR